MKRLLTIGAAVMLLPACAVGPNYQEPNTPPAVVQNAASSAFLAQDPEAAWWQEFEDPELDALERRALTANLDLRIASDRVRSARAIFVENKFDYAPHVPLQGGYAKSVE